MENSSPSFTARLSAAATSIVQIERCTVEANRLASEVVWSHILNDTICESNWLENRDLLPHQYASGHQTLYVLYRILNESRPTRILCVGQGVMLQVVSQYARMDKGIEVRAAGACGDSPCDLVCVEAGQPFVDLPWMKLSECGTIIIDDACRVLNDDDIDKYAKLIRDTDRTAVVGRYEGVGMCYVITGEDKVYLTSM
jgi:hypothetical protein